jgi:hypothetical protein
LLFHKLAKDLKKEDPTSWIYKLDLNDHSDALSNLTENKLSSSDDAVKFVGENILKLKSNIEMTHLLIPALKLEK